MAIQTKLSNLKLTIPTDVGEITLGQFIQLRELGDRPDTIGMVSILTGISKERLSGLNYSGRTEREFEGIMKLTTLLSGAIRDFNASPDKMRVPKKIRILGKDIHVPQDLEEEPFWPSRITKQTMIENQNDDGAFDPLRDLDKVLAHYLYVPYTGMTYNEARAEEFREIVKELPFDTAVRIGNFFLLKSARFWMPKRTYWWEMYRAKKYRLAYRILRFLGMSTR